MTYDIDRPVVHPQLSEEELHRLYPPGLTLKLVQIVHRHGERTPIASYVPSFISAVWQMDPNQFKSTIHSSSHPGIERPSSGTESQPAIIQPKLNPTDESLFQFVSRDNLANVGTIQRQIEELHHDNKLPPIPAPGQCFFGQLTDKGRETLYQMGTSFRSLYVDKLKFLPESMTDANVQHFYLRTTDYPRTLESLHHLFGGLYPKSMRLLKQPPVVYTRWLHDETMYAHGQCKKWRHIVNKFKDAYRKSNAEHIKQMQAKHNHFLSDTTKPNLHALYDTFIAVYAHGMPLPSGLKPADIVELEIHAQNLWFEVYRKNNEAVRLSIGRFVNELKHKIEKRVNGESEVKIAVYAGHDSTIAPLLGAFDVNDGKWPPFAANMVFELFENEGNKHFVRVKYNGQPVLVPHCQAAGKYHEKDKSLCTVEAFFELMNRSIPKDFDKECALEEDSKSI